jgi:hypothetical protein
MILDTTSPRHRRIERLWNLTDDEKDRFYREAGRATVTPDENDNILACSYATLDGPFQPDDEQTRYAADVMPLTRHRVVVGWMSSGQFMTEKES